MTMNEFLKELENVTQYLSPEAIEFYNDLKNKESNTFTEKGKAILKAMQDNKEKYMNVFTSKQLGELCGMAPRSVSGSIKKLINQGYAEKKGLSPVSYGITLSGDALQLDN